MKKFVDLLEEIRNYRVAIENLDSEEKRINEDYKKILDGFSFKEKVDYRKNHAEEIEAMDKKLANIYTAKSDIEIIVKLAKHNCRVALYREVLPVVLDVLEKYNGKPYGEKTKAKISKEVEEKTNCRFDISNYYTEKYVIIPMGFVSNDYNIEVCGKYIDGNNVHLLVNNKIQTVTMEELQPVGFYDEYIEDLTERKDELKRLFQLAKEKEEELKEICSQFNNIAPTGIDHILHYNGIRHYLI